MKHELNTFWTLALNGMDKPEEIVRFFQGTTEYPILTDTKLMAYYSNGFFSYLKEQGEQLYNDVINHFTPAVKNRLAALVVGRHYQITSADEELFLYLQQNVEKKDKIVWQELNLNNPDFTLLLNKHHLNVEKTTTFEETFSTLIFSLKNKSLSFKEACEYIDTYQDIWKGKLSSSKGGKLPSEFSEEIFNTLSTWDVSKHYENEKETPYIKKFLAKTGVPFENFYKNPALLQNFMPWFVKNSTNEEWDKFTQGWANIKDERRHKRAASFLLNENIDKNQINWVNVLRNFTSFYSRLMQNQTPIEKINWWANNFLNDVGEYLKSDKNHLKSMPWDYYTSSNKKQYEIKEIPQVVRQNPLTFINWMRENDQISPVHYEQTKPVAEEFHLNNAIPVNNKKSGVIKI